MEREVGGTGMVWGEELGGSGFSAWVRLCVTSGDRGMYLHSQ